MGEADPRIEAFYSSAPRWGSELAAFRAILLGAGLAEEFKWRGPCYTSDGANIATLWGFKESCQLGFFKGGLLKDPEGILQAQGARSRAMRVVKATSTAEIARLKPVLAAYLREAVAIEQAGLRLDLPKDDIAFPDELTERLAEDPILRAALDALTPGRRRGWLLHFTEPKQSATRASRIDKAAPRILAGKGPNDR